MKSLNTVGCAVKESDQWTARLDCVALRQEETICVCVCVCVCVGGWVGGVCVYVCMYVCMCVCVCMYVCICVCMCVCMYVCMYVCVCMSVRMYVYMSVRVYVRQYICILSLATTQTHYCIVPSTSKRHNSSISIHHLSLPTNVWHSYCFSCRGRDFNSGSGDRLCRPELWSSSVAAGK